MKDASIGIVFSQNGEAILIVQRHDVPIWVLPGGGIDLFESPEQAAVREVEEETGFKVRIKRKIGEYTPINKLSGFTHTFECEIVSGEPRISAESVDVQFYQINELPKNFFTVHRDWLNDAQLNMPEVIKKEISQVTYWALFCFFLQHPLVFLRFLITRLKTSN